MEISNKIESNIPIEKVTVKSRKYYEENVIFLNMLNKLHLKDSFVIILDKKKGKVEKARLIGWLQTYREQHKELKFKLRTLDDESIRIWRIK